MSLDRPVTVASRRANGRTCGLSPRKKASWVSSSAKMQPTDQMSMPLP